MGAKKQLQEHLPYGLTGVHRKRIPVEKTPAFLPADQIPVHAPSKEIPGNHCLAGIKSGQQGNPAIILKPLLAQACSQP
jgi:hypothetical protein